MTMESEERAVETLFELMSPYQHVSELNYLLRVYMRRVENKVAKGNIEDAIGDLQSMERLIDEIIEILREHNRGKVS